MATQGIVSVIVNGEVAVKAIAGSDGYNASILAEEIQRNHITSPEEIFNLAQEIGFGDQESLVVQSPDKNLYEGDADLAGLYLDRSKFADPEFNPRWERGTADHIEVVKFEG